LCLTLDTRLYYKNIKYIFAFNIFVFVVYLYVSVSNILLFFLLYECLLLPSFLFVYFVAPSRRAIQASLYFVIWTQLGSILVLCCIVYILSISGNINFFSLKNFKFTNYEITYLYLFIFLGFGLFFILYLLFPKLLILILLHFLLFFIHKNFLISFLFRLLIIIILLIISFLYFFLFDLLF
jgi:hypothetical protein